MERKKRIWIIVVAGIIIIIIICFIVLTAVVSSFFPVEHLDYGLDFSNGKNVLLKQVNGKRVWRRYVDCKEREDIIKKYHLGYGEPILSFYGSDTFKYTFFHIDTLGNGVKFWKWDYSFFEERQINKVRGYSPYSTFFYIVEKFKPSPEDVKKMYFECVRIYESRDDVFRRTLVYLKDRHHFYKTFHPDQDIDSKKQMRRYESYQRLPER